MRQADRCYQRHQFAQLRLTEEECQYLVRANNLCGSATFNLQLGTFNRPRRHKRATEMLADLKEAKMEAQRQYLARKAGKAGVAPY